MVTGRRWHEEVESSPELSMCPLWPGADAGALQECDSTSWAKRNEMSHMRNAGNLVFRRRGYHKPRCSRCLLSQSCRDGRVLLVQNNSQEVERRCTAIHTSRLIVCLSFTRMLLLWGWNVPLRLLIYCRISKQVHFPTFLIVFFIPFGSDCREFRHPLWV